MVAGVVRSDTEDVTLGQVYALLHEEHRWTEERLDRLETQIQAGQQSVQAALADLHVQYAGLRCREHRDQVETVTREMAELRADMKRRHLIWGGSGFVGGVAAAVATTVAAVKAYLEKGAGN